MSRFNVDGSLKKILDEGASFRTRVPAFVGAKSKVSVAAFIDALLRMNEESPQDAKLSDAQMVDIVKEEFKDNPTTVKTFSKKFPLATYRGKFNRGSILQAKTSDTRRRYFSVPYDPESGLPIKNRRPMTKSEYLSGASKFDLGVYMDERESRYVISTTEHFGVVPKAIFKLAKTKSDSKKPKLAKV